MATPADGKKTVVVDAGAAIKLQRIENVGNAFFTTEEVHAEVKDTQARRHLQTLPFDLQQKQPFKEDLQAVKKFAKETGDNGFLSANDIGLLALAVRLHRESGSQVKLREKPEMAEVSQRHVPFSWAPAESHFRRPARSEMSNLDTFTLLGEQEGNELEEGNELHEEDLLEELEDDCDSDNEVGENDPRKCDTFPEAEQQPPSRDGDEESSASSGLREPKAAVDAAVADHKLAESLAEKCNVTSTQDQQSAEQPEKPKAVMSWAERAAAARNVAVVSTKVKVFVTPEVEPLPELTPGFVGTPLKTRREEVPWTSGLTAGSGENRSSAEQEQATSSRELVFGPRTPDTEDKRGASAATTRCDDEGDDEGESTSNTKSRILSSAVAGIQDFVVDVDGEDSDSSEDWESGWVTSENINRLNNTIDTNTEEGDEKEESPIAVLSTDYSVQNVAIQMGLQVVSMDGYRIRSVKLWGKICRACFATTRDTTKLYCPKCGNPTLDRCPYTLDAQGRVVMHDNRRRKPNLRGTVYSIPKRRGGRNQDLLLREDEQTMGGRDRQIRYEQRLQEKQRQIREKNDDIVDGWCARHITGAGNAVNRGPGQFKHGYGYGARRNPNANNFKKPKYK
eukprot:g5996.t1